MATVSAEGTPAEYRDRVASFVGRTQLQGELARAAANLSEEGLSALIGQAHQLRYSSIERAASFTRAIHAADGFPAENIDCVTDETEESSRVKTKGDIDV